MLSITQAIDLLARLQSAAPPATAARLADVVGLLRALDAENAYLNTVIRDSLVSPAVTGQTATDATVRPGGVYQIALPDEPEPVPEPSLAASTPPFAAGPDDIEELLAALEATLSGSSPVADHSGSDDLLLRLDEAMRPALETAVAQTQALQSGRLGRMTTEQTDVLGTVYSGIDMAINTLDAVGLLHALRGGDLSLQVDVFEVADLLREAHNLVFNAARQREHHLNVRFPDDGVRARGDYERVVGILIDLLDNAIRYTPVGGAIQLSADHLGTHVLISVDDNGIGLSADDLTHVGESFWRALHRPLVRQQPGTGLSLHLARELLTRQGGELIFSGEEAQGCTFSFTLPAAAQTT